MELEFLMHETMISSELCVDNDMAHTNLHKLGYFHKMNLSFLRLVLKGIKEREHVTKGDPCHTHIHFQWSVLGCA